jgi:hypothetical protein
MRWLVMPMEQPVAMDEAPRAIRGWWLGARTIRQNPRAGGLLADAISREMAGFEFVNLYSSIDLKYYFADKRDMLKKSYDYLSDAEVDKLLGQVPPVEFARELGADKMVSGRIIRNYMGENRTIHWWWSVVEFECQVTDVPTGKVEWTRRYELREQFASQNSVQLKLAEEVVADLKDEYFRPLANQ